MKALAITLAAFAMLATGVAHAQCYGSNNYKTCTDDSGNSYVVKKYGGTTQVDGYNYRTGSSWSQSTRQVGNTAYTTGHDAQGNTWSQNSRTSGNTTYQSGYDSDGNAYNGTIRRTGNSVNYSGTDSDGNYYNKTCTAYGCY